MKLALFQMRSTEDIWENLSVVSAAVEEAQKKGADLVCFPENALFRGRRALLPPEAVMTINAQGELAAEGEFAKELRSVIESWQIDVALGSVVEKSLDPKRPYNSHWLIHKNHKIRSYQKIHLFDFQGSQGSYRESDECSAGSTVVVDEVNQARVGLAICYDLRFPELFRKMSLEQGAQLILLPAAFTRETGQAHWHSLLRARAIENLCFVGAAAQWGSHKSKNDQDLYCFGHSMIISPWGEVLAEGPAEGDALIMAEIDLDEISRRRQQLPAMSSARLWRP